MKVYIITRFTILDYSHKEWKTVLRKSSEEYESYLFSKERLDYKFTSFEKITLPSVVNQTNKNYVWEIYTSEYLPVEYKDRLLALVSKHKNIKVFFVKSFKEILDRSSGTEDKYCTARLDDDDGLNKSFVEMLQKYKDKTKEIISFTEGKLCTVLNSEIIYGKDVSYKKIAAGLCAIDMNIHRCGNHSKIDEKYKVTYDATPNMYVVNCSEFCDGDRIFLT